MGCAQRIVLVIGSLGGGGAERVLVDLANYLVSVDRDVAVLTIVSGDEDVYELDGRVMRLRIDIRRDSKNLAGSVIRELSGLRRIRSAIWSFRPDTVVSFIDQTNIRVTAALLATGIPLFVSERVHPGYHSIGRVWGVARWLLYRFATAVVVQTHEIADWTTKNIPSRCVVTIPNAVRAERFGTKAKHSPREMAGSLVLGIGRLTHQKGFDLLIQAFDQAELPSAGWRLVILGEGPDRANLQSLINQLGLRDSVIMPGFAPDVAAWLRRCDIFVLSSRFEGFPHALLEAMQTGCPAISFDCPSGPRDLISSGDNGILLPQQDVDALAEAIRTLATDPTTRTRLGATATAVSERFSPQRVYGMWLDLIDSPSLR